ncbi:pyridine nucleotide-disulfide oxidoreductase [Neptunitalea chrysea]|uniref:Pyridine nucleotide-disulfide oxidoreductase n=1 Tax=Neptunitalea chrysea TaxID=1647581 RepID=A0A9W6EVU7_9FLAO|nr:YpdA family putative bacillithiol disulfide reductase [Neptunitalea chrysea]GLB51998.1 pyridine nucleotide-disulfide oxidoreductase [Neptunitalea chrysea]
MYDIIIIGGGPIGIACGLEAKKNNLSHLIIEKGCITNSIFNYPLNMHFFSTSDKLEIDNIPFICKEPKPQRNEALEYYRRIVTSNKLNIKLYEEVTNIENNNDFTVTTSKDKYTAKNVIIATGFYDIPNLIKVPGENLPKVSHYYTEPHLYVNQKVAVIGASNSSVDAALECYRKGADVTMIVRQDAIGERVKYWVKPDIENRIKEGSIKALFNANITEIKEDTIQVHTPEGTIEIENDFVLALTGYMPNFKFLKMAKVSLNTEDALKPSYNPETMETNIDNLYLAGVICGGMETHKWFIENSIIHAELITKNILFKQKTEAK